MRRPPVLRRLPRMRWRDVSPQPPVAPDEYAKYPSLADDLAFLDAELVPTFVDLDRRAQREQNRFRRQHLLILVGGLATTMLGALQAALADAAWPGIAVAIVGAAVGSFTFVSRQRRSQSAYLHARLRAEQLRSLCFRYLGRVGEFTDQDRRAQRLVGAIEAIKNAPEAQ